MKNKSHRTLVLNKPSEADISAYAYHLYEEGGHVHGHDVANWHEAIACLNANIPSHQSHRRMQHSATAPTAGSVVAGFPAVPVSLDS